MSGTSKLEELKKRILFTIFMLGVYRIATQVPTPGIDATALSAFVGGLKGSLFGIFNTFSGGALERFSVLALGVTPYITTSIIFSLLSFSVPALEELRKDPDGYKKINQYTRYATVLLCAFQSYFLAVGLESARTPNNIPVVLEPGYGFRFLTMISLTAGTMFVMWLGEQITERGLGNGISLIIFAGIAAGIPSGIRDTFTLLSNGELTIASLLIVAAVMIASFWFIIFIERAFRKVPVQYAKRVVNNRVFGGQTTHLPIKVNNSGVMPAIFASALLGFPMTIATFVPQNTAAGDMLNNFSALFAPGRMLYNVVFTGFIIFFAYFYSSIQFKTEEISENIRKDGGFIPGIRPGEQTVSFLNMIVGRLTLVGAIYVALICILPAILSNYAKVPFYFGGTSLLILVSVAIDTMAQAEGFMISQRLDTAYKVRGKYSGVKRF
jgi:preprotein translocase subunit SecY